MKTYNVILTERQLKYIASYAGEMQLKAQDANRPEAEKFYGELFELMLAAETDSALENI
jgi:hypothetical protein